MLIDTALKPSDLVSLLEISVSEPPIANVKTQALHVCDYRVFHDKLADKILQCSLALLMIWGILRQWGSLKPARSCRTFFSDFAKQLFGVAACWFVNPYLVALSSNYVDEKFSIVLTGKSADSTDPCAWDWVLIMTHATLGVILLWVFIKLSQCIFRYESGRYFDKIDAEKRWCCSKWIWQLCVHCMLAIIVRLTIIGIIWKFQDKFIRASQKGTDFMPKEFRLDYEIATAAFIVFLGISFTDVVIRHPKSTEPKKNSAGAPGFTTTIDGARSPLSPRNGEHVDDESDTDEDIAQAREDAAKKKEEEQKALMNRITDLAHAIRSDCQKYPKSGGYGFAKSRFIAAIPAEDLPPKVLYEAFIERWLAGFLAYWEDKYSMKDKKEPKGTIPLLAVTKISQSDNTPEEVKITYEEEDAAGPVKHKLKLRFENETRAFEWQRSLRLLRTTLEEENVKRKEQERKGSKERR